MRPSTNGRSVTLSSTLRGEALFVLSPQSPRRRSTAGEFSRELRRLHALNPRNSRNLRLDSLLVTEQVVADKPLPAVPISKQFSTCHEEDSPVRKHLVRFFFVPGLFKHVQDFCSMEIHVVQPGFGSSFVMRAIDVPSFDAFEIVLKV